MQNNKRSWSAFLQSPEPIELLRRNVAQAEALYSRLMGEAAVARYERDLAIARLRAVEGNNRKE